MTRVVSRIDGRARDFLDKLPPYKFVGGTLTSAQAQTRGKRKPCSTRIGDGAQSWLDEKTWPKTSELSFYHVLFDHSNIGNLGQM